jgi:hypothetical protein
MKCSCGEDVELRPTGTVGFSHYKKVATGDTILEWVLASTPEGAVNDPQYAHCSDTNLRHNVRGVMAEYRRSGVVVFRQRRGH